MTLTLLNLRYAPHHFDVKSVPRDPRSKVILTKRTPRECVVFVHGFSGDALATWKGFEDEPLHHKSFEHTDLIFFGYDGRESNALAAASFLSDLLHPLLSAPEQVLGVLRTGSWQYERCVLVCHSLGAVVSRWVLLRAWQEKREWLEKVRYVLFAPAHCGGVVADRIREALSEIPIVGGILSSVAEAKLPLISELTPGSSILHLLEERTREAVAKGATVLKASKVVVAEYEIVVSNLPFAADPYPIALREATHTSVCKLIPGSLEPLRFIEEQLI